MEARVLEAESANVLQTATKTNNHARRILTLLSTMQAQALPKTQVQKPYHDKVTVSHLLFAEGM